MEKWEISIEMFITHPAILSRAHESFIQSGHKWQSKQHDSSAGTCFCWGLKCDHGPWRTVISCNIDMVAKLVYKGIYIQQHELYDVCIKEFYLE